jgi:hypothetical protein
MSNCTFNPIVSEIELAQMTPAERNWYEARLAGMSDEASRLEYVAKQGFEEGYKIGYEEGYKIGVHEALLEILTMLSQKRFPGLSQETLAKIFLLNSEQLDKQLDLILDYNSKQEFEDAIAALPVK